MAESIWIWKGRRDLEFLKIFNKQMEAYSDDGKNFHSPYGWRLRHYGVDPAVNLTEENMHMLGTNNVDQLHECIRLLNKNPDDRRVVASLWNPDLDLGRNMKDHPCNSMLMFKIRQGKLHQTIQNRSNDLDWGLTTNVFQFSFIGEVMAALLGVTYGTQTHNSQSLHLYLSNPLTTELEAGYQKIKTDDYQATFYENFTNMPIEFKFKSPDLNLSERLFWVDFYLHAIILKLLKRNAGTEATDLDDEAIFLVELKEFCYYFYCMYRVLGLYVDYKKHGFHKQTVVELLSLNNELGLAKYDFFVLSLNFFMRRIFDKSKSEFNTVLQTVLALIPGYKNIPVGKL